MAVNEIHNIEDLVNQIGNGVIKESFVQNNVLDFEADNIYQRVAVDVLTTLNESYVLEDFDSDPEKVYQKVLKIVEEILGGRDMKLEGVQDFSHRDDKILPQFKERDQMQNQGSNSRLSIIYKSGKTEGNSPLSDLPTIEKLKSQTENIYGKLINMVEEIISRQVKTQLSLNSAIKPFEQLGEETISDKVVDFINEASKGEKGKTDILIKGVSEGFKMVEESLGRLPQISIRTYEKIVEKLNNYTIIEAINKEPQRAETIIRAVVEEVIGEQLEDSGLLEGLDLSRADNELLKYINLSKEKQGIFIQKHITDTNVGVSKEDYALEENKITSQKEFIKGHSKESEGIKLIIREKVLASRIKDLPFEKQYQIENTSKRLVSLIKEASGEDKPKMVILIKTVKETFEDAEKALGLLPESTKKTYEKIIEEFEAEGYGYKYMWPYIFGEGIRFFNKGGLIRSSNTKIFFLVILFIIILYFGSRLL